MMDIRLIGKRGYSETKLNLNGISPETIFSGVPNTVFDSKRKTCSKVNPGFS